jgi:hypothetical protein
LHFFDIVLVDGSRAFLAPLRAIAIGEWTPAS